MIPESVLYIAVNHKAFLPKCDREESGNQTIFSCAVHTKQKRQKSVTSAIKRCSDADSKLIKCYH